MNPFAVLALFWVAYGLLGAWVLRYAFHRVEGAIEDGETELIPKMSLIYSKLEGLGISVSQFCLIGGLLLWPVLFYELVRLVLKDDKE